MRRKLQSACFLGVGFVLLILLSIHARGPAAASDSSAEAQIRSVLEMQSAA
jgi:hypothetical protein